MAVTGPDFIALQVRNLAEAAAFYEDVVGLIPAESSPPNAAVFQTRPVAFAVRQAEPGVDLRDHPGTGVALCCMIRKRPHCMHPWPLLG